MGLQRYWKKRNFKATPEPRGKAKPSSGQLSYVIQKHAATRLHYDFRLELDGTLKSWAVPKGPSLDPAQKRLAVHVEDHPLDYAGFEGIIPPKQYGAGTVLLWDRGDWIPIGDPRSSYRRGRLKFHLNGKKLHGIWNLVRMGGRQEGKENWLLIKEKDEEARKGQAGEVTQRLTGSVDSGRTIEQIASGRHRVWHSNRSQEEKAGPETKLPETDVSRAAGARRAPPPKRIAPQLATLVDHAPEGDEWVHELKYDGYRLLSRIQNGAATLFTRNGHDWTPKLHRIADAVSSLCRQGWVDGEVVALMSDGTVSFQALQNAFDTKSETNLVYYLFDLLYLDGYDLRKTPLIERKRILTLLLGQESQSEVIRYSDHIAGKGAVVFEEACRQGMEGIISKRGDAAYMEGRTRHWVKVKCGQRQEFVIGGYSDPAGSRKGFGALLLGVYDTQGNLRYAGRTGTGFTERSLKDLHTRLSALAQTDPPFVNPPTGADAQGVHWVKPQLVAEVAFAQWTSEGLLRQAAFQGLREDKPARSIIHERPQTATTVEGAPAHTSHRRRWRRTGETTRIANRTKPAQSDPSVVAGVTLTHPDRILYPEVSLTKLALARYYEQVAAWILPHLKDRPLTLVRCPEGYDKECFYQKHATETVPKVVGRVEIPEGKETVCYMVADSLPAIIGLVQMGVLELHTWGAKRDRLERPDRIIFDLDPDPSVAWTSVVEAAQLVRTLLEELKLTSFIKTTGGKGLHIVLPIQRVHTWDEVKTFSKAMADHLARMIPDRFVANMSKHKRKDKIYVDYLRNARGATAIAAYSTRARAGAPVSVPLAWDELSPELRSDHFTVSDVMERLNGLERDPWRDYYLVKQKLTPPMKAALSVSGVLKC